MPDLCTLNMVLNINTFITNSVLIRNIHGMNILKSAKGNNFGTKTSQNTKPVNITPV